MRAEYRDMRLGLLFGNEYGKLVLGNLCNSSTFCIVCDLACNFCRQAYGSYASDLFLVYDEPENLPSMIESPEEYLLRDPLICDLILAIGLHPDLLLEIPRVAEKTEAKAIIVPIESNDWCPPGLRSQLKHRFEEVGLEYAFPKPFCSLEETGNKMIDEFIRRYRIGRPVVEVDVDDGTVSGSACIRSAPCGSTWYVARQIMWCEVSKIEDAVARAHHSYPCVASMEIDPEIGEPILHEGGYIIRKAVRKAIEESYERKRISNKKR